MVCITGKNGTERKFLFFLFLGLFQPIFAWNEAITVSFNLLNFFVIFFEFSLMRRVGMKQQDNFYFLSLSLFQPVLAWNAAEIVFFLIFWKILLFFWNFLLRIGMEQNRTIISIFSISRPFPTYFGLKWSHNGIVWYFDFFATFMEFSITRRIGTKRNDNFYFHSSSTFSTLFWLQKKP